MRLRLMSGFMVLAFAPLLRAETPGEAIKPFVEKNSLAGAVVLVASPEAVLSVEAVGYSDRAAKVPMKADDLFWIASMSKPITAAAVMIAVDEGKVKLDDPIEKYLPEFKGLMLVAEKDAEHVLLKKPKRPPTVRDCLNHTSGMPFKSALEEPTLDQWRLRDVVRSYAMTPLLTEPGTKYLYSNAGINTAGRIVEVVSGMPFETFLEKRLFGPLGMKDTSFFLTAEQVKRLAKSYKPNKAGTDLEEMPIAFLLHPLTDPSRQPMPGGGLFSTAGDVAKFCQMVLRGGTRGNARILSEASVREMTSTQTGDLLNKGQGEAGYGLGWSTTKKAKESTVVPGTAGHGGAYATNMSINPDTELVTVFMVQHAGFANGDGGKIRPAFEKAAVEAFGKK